MSAEPTCKACGKRVLFAKDEKGTVQILDLTAPVYVKMFYSNVPQELTCTRLPSAHVSHFSVCPNANQFSKGKKKENTK